MRERKVPIDGVAARDDDDDAGEVINLVVDNDGSGDEDNGERNDTSLALEVAPEKSDRCFVPFACVTRVARPELPTSKSFLQSLQ